MKGQNSIIVTKDYGAVKLNLKKLMDEKGISRNTMARSVNVRFEVIDRWYNGNVEKLDLDILARICYVLGCGISDIMEYDLSIQSESLQK